MSEPGVDGEGPAETGRGWLPWLVDGAIRMRAILLVVGLGSAALAWGPSRRLEFDRSVEGLFRPDDPHLLGYLEAKELFGGTETALVGYSDPRLISVEGLSRLKALGDKLRALDGVRSVVSLAEARLPGAPLSADSLIKRLRAGTIDEQWLREELVSCDLYRDRLLSADGRTAALMVGLRPVGQRTASRAVTVRRIREICAEHQPAAVVAGGPILVEEVYRNLEDDGRLLGIASSLVLAIVIGLLFRNPRWIILPLAVVQVTLLWTKAILAFSGIQLSMVSSPLVALVTVIGGASVVHLTIRFREEREREDSPTDALRRTLTALVPAVFWTCLTTAAGFCSLMASRIVPVGGFGLMMAVGSMMVFVAILVLFPGGVLLGRFGTDPARSGAERRMAEALDRFVSIVQRRPWLVTSCAAGLLLLAAIGFTRLRVATDFDENFRRSSSIVQSFRFLSDRLGTTAVMDVLVDTPDPADTAAFDRFLEQLRELQRDIERRSGVQGTTSVADVLDFVSGTRMDQATLAERLQAGTLALLNPSAKLELLRGREPALISSLWNRDRNVMRIVVQVGPVRGAAAKQHLIESIEQAARRRFPQARVAGVFVLLTYSVKSLLADQGITFVLAVVAIFVMMTVAFRDWRLGLAAMIPNATPIVIVVGFMGWCGLKMNMATAMLASVSMGLTVDFSIHYLYRFRSELRRRGSVGEAIRAAHGSVGLAMILANVALIAGFSTLVISSFIPTVHFGILVSVAMIGGLLGNLTALPLMLSWMRLDERKPGTGP